MGGKSGGTIIGYKYFIGAHLVLCTGPVDKITKLIADGDKIAWEGTTTGGQISVDSPELFGGDNAEGGIVGTLDILMGDLGQGVNAYLAGVLGTSDLPGFRGVVSVILNKVYIGNFYYLKQWAFLATRIHTAENGSTIWQSSLAEPTTGNINPVHMIREILLSPQYGLTTPVGDINETSFVTAAQTLFNEHFGLSYLWNDDSTVEDILNRILSHIDASLFINPSTGLFEIFLIRDNYVVNDLALLNENYIEEVTNFFYPTLDTLVNEVQVTYWDITTHKENTVLANNIALFQKQGTVITEKITYDMVTNKELATKLAQRDLKRLSLPIAKITFKVDRSVANAIIGTPFRLSWEDLSINELIFRVTDINLGTVNSGQVTITAVEDVFTYADIVYIPPVASGWIDPISIPLAVTKRIVQEMPYYIYARAKGDAAAQAVAVGSTFLVCAGSYPSPDALSAGIYVESGTTYSQKGTMSFCAYAELYSSIGKTDTSLSVNAAKNWNLLAVDQFIQIGTEIMKLVSYTQELYSIFTFIVERGVLDTLPVAHINTDKIYAWEKYNGAPQVEYLTTDVVRCKLLTKTGKGTLPLSAAPVDTITMVDRFHKPYPPGKFQINGVAFPLTTTGTSLVVTWKHRNRLTETAGLFGQLYGTITPEVGTTYNCRLYDGTTLITNTTGITGETTTFTGFGTLIAPHIKLESVCNGLTSFQAYNHSFSHS